MKLVGVLEKKIPDFPYCIFSYFVTISLLKRAWPFIWTNLNRRNSRMLCAKFGWNFALAGLEKKILRFRQCICIRYSVNLPLEEGVILHLNKLESSLPKDAKCAKFCWNWPSGSGEEGENMKNIQTDGHTDE